MWGEPMSTVTADMTTRATAARNAARSLAGVSTDQKNRALARIKEELQARKADIVEANDADMKRSEEEGIAAPLLKRLRFDEKKLGKVQHSIDGVAALEDPTGRIVRSTELDEGLELEQRTCPLGVIGMIFESRPDALVQIASLCLKSGNAVMLKGGREAKETNAVLVDAIAAATADAGIPDGWIQLIETREDVTAMLALDGLIDLIIPRGSNEFVRYIMENTRIPVLGHADGVCHAYVDRSADIEMAISVVVDAKTQYVAVCNAIETLLVHTDIAEEALPRIATALREKGVELRGCERSRQIDADMKAVTEDDWTEEYLDYILAVRVVDSLDEAIEHVNRYGSNHTDAIVTSDEGSAQRFMELIDSASVMWNCSTRFADGFRYGLGAEVGISTAKIHARGPVGLDGLVSTKWMVRGTGQAVAPYADGSKRFTHRQRQ
jgi:glutamate-5-semialdehyde dehydrogenase